MVPQLPREVLERILYRTIRPYWSIDRSNQPLEQYWHQWNGDSLYDVLFRLVNHTQIRLAPGAAHRDNANLSNRLTFDLTPFNGETSEYARLASMRHIHCRHVRISLAYVSQCLDDLRLVVRLIKTKMARLKEVEIRINDAEKLMFPERVLDFMGDDDETTVSDQFRAIIVELSVYLERRKIKPSFVLGSPWLDNKLVEMVAPLSIDYEIHTFDPNRIKYSKWLNVDKLLQSNAKELKLHFRIGDERPIIENGRIDVVSDVESITILGENGEGFYHWKVYCAVLPWEWCTFTSLKRVELTLPNLHERWEMIKHRNELYPAFGLLPSEQLTINICLDLYDWLATGLDGTRWSPVEIRAAHLMAQVVDHVKQCRHHSPTIAVKATLALKAPNWAVAFKMKPLLANTFAHFTTTTIKVDTHSGWPSTVAQRVFTLSSVTELEDFFARD